MRPPGLAGGNVWAEPNVRKWAEPQVRRQIVEVILQAREKDMQAAEHIRRGLGK